MEIKRTDSRASGDGRQMKRARRPIPGRETERFEELVRSVPDIRAARVEELRARIESGTYHVDADKIAEKIIADHTPDETI